MIFWQFFEAGILVDEGGGEAVGGFGDPAGERDGGTRLEDFSTAGAVGSARGEEKGNVGTERGAHFDEVGKGGGAIEEFIEGPESGGCIAASAAKTCLDRNLFLNVDGDRGGGKVGSKERESFEDKVGRIGGDGRIGAASRTPAGIWKWS